VDNQFFSNFPASFQVCDLRREGVNVLDVQALTLIWLGGSQFARLENQTESGKKQSTRVQPDIRQFRPVTLQVAFSVSDE
jgi:hypothetical protein